MIAEPAASTPAPDAPPGRTFMVGVVLSTGGKVIFTACGALITVLVARELGPSGQGTFAVAFSLTLLLVQVGSIGLPVANPYLAAREPETQRAIVMHSLWIAVVASLGLAAVTALVKAVEPNTLRGLTWVQLAITLGALPAALATLYLQSVTLGQKRMAWYALVDITQVGTALIALIIAFLAADPGLDVVLLVVAGGRYLALILAAFSLRSVLRAPSTPSPGLVRRMLGHAARVYVVALLSFALIRLDLLIVNGVLGSKDAGQYSIAAYVCEALIVIPSVVASNLLPRIATSDDTTMTAAVLRSLTLGWAAIIAVSVPLAAVAIPLAVGDGYDEAVTLYAWLAPGVFFLGLLSTLISHYWVRGYPPSLIAAWTAALGVNVAGNVLLLHPFGVGAAPIVSTVTYAGVLVVHLVVFSQEAGGWHALRPDPRETVGLVRTAVRR